MTRILYIEDNEDNIYMLTQRLTRHGFEVSIASDGAQGIDMAIRERPDLILMDLGLPALDGWAATRQLKHLPDTKDIPILALSAHTMPGDRDKALDAGCDDYDTKPVVFERLLGKIDALVRKRGLP
ncbi:response regulator [Microvirga sp. BSC39]|uniref:response regulator n=1 Tax=Microvirga sp. BSC39 TaxID=1549810 RepID=UPI0004E87284|nr:response regulator [Microvirga sp. BSC39]KFG67019.1 chemotaxis protein CheY [Microvirga sp. BSC39]